MPDEKIKKCLAKDLPDNIIGAAVLVESNKIPHAGIFIRYNGRSRLFHFDSKDVLLENFSEDDVYFFTEIPFIKPELAASFLMHCEVVLKEAKPKFGFFYVGSLFDEKGRLHTPGDMPEYMTCVGFCLNFLKFYSEGKDLFELKDWDAGGIARGEDHVEKFIEKVRREYPGVKIEDFKKGLRRIWPEQYFCGMYSKELPVTKEFIDDNLPAIKKELLGKARA